MKNRFLCCNKWLGNVNETNITPNLYETPLIYDGTRRDRYKIITETESNLINIEMLPM